MIVFLLLSVGLFMTPFFTLLVADMRSFFNTLPLIMCIFLPAVTMRIWAEERKQNTWEMLLTFPMQSHELVLGKFFAGLVFFVIALAGTLTIPWMLAALGNPDFGTIAAAYLGAILLGRFLPGVGVVHLQSVQRPDRGLRGDAAGMPGAVLSRHRVPGALR